MRQYDKIMYIDQHLDMKYMEDLQVTVKYDGSNGRLTYEDGQLMFGSRKQEANSIDKLKGNFPVTYKPLVKTIARLPDAGVIAIQNLLEDIVLYFEVCGSLNKHKLQYSWDIRYIVFDGWDKKEEKYIPFTDPRVKRIVDMLGLFKAEVLDIKDYDSAYNWMLKQNGMLIEGVVLKDYETGERCKILHPKNNEMESSMFTKHKKAPHYNESKFLHTYITTNRIEKLYNKIKNDEGVTGMRAMGDLLRKMFEDLTIECLPEFILKNKPKNIDILYLRKHIPQLVKPLFMTFIQK